MHNDGSSAQTEIAVPTHFLCPISLSLMKDPVTLRSGITYDRSSIEKWFNDGHRTCPVANTFLGDTPDIIPNEVLRRMIDTWLTSRISDDKVQSLVQQVSASSADADAAASALAKHLSAANLPQRDVKAILDALLSLLRRRRGIYAAIPVEPLIELMLGKSKAVAERAAAVLQVISAASADARAAIRGHALALPVLLRSLLIISETANENIVAILGSVLGTGTSAENANFLVEAAALGATQKLVVLAQMDCSARTKRHVASLLRSLAPLDDCTDPSFISSQRLIV